MGLFAIAFGSYVVSSHLEFTSLENINVLHSVGMPSYHIPMVRVVGYFKVMKGKYTFGSSMMEEMILKIH